MAGELQLPLDQMRDAATFVKSTADGLVAAVSKVDRMMASFLGEGWFGPAASSFDSGWADWKTGADDVTGGLSSMAALLAHVIEQIELSDNAFAAGLAEKKSQI